MSKFVKVLFIILVFVAGSEVSSQPITWQRILGYTDNAILRKAQQTSDGGYIAVGTSIIGIYQKLYLVKFNPYGDTLWTRYFDTSVSGSFEGYWVEETLDKGFIIAGDGEGPNGDAYLIKTDSIGNIKWYKTFGGSGLDQGLCVKQLTNIDFILMARTTSINSTNDIMLIKTDSVGNKIWSKIYGNNIYEEFGEEIQIIGNSGFIIDGAKEVSGQRANLYLIRTNMNGDSVWTKTYNQYLGSAAYSIDLAIDRGFILGGFADSTTNNEPKAYIVKTDSNGTIEWQRRYSTGFNELCYSIKTLNKKGYVFCGMSDSTFLGYERVIVRTIDNSGNIINENYFSPGPDNHSFQSVNLTNDNGFILCGYAKYGLTQAYIVRTDSNCNIKPVGIINNNIAVSNFELFQNYPNPFNSQSLIKYDIDKYGLVNIKLYDITGKLLANLVNDYKIPGKYSYILDASKYNLSSGIYILILTKIIPMTNSIF
jgi:hypothetical protein